MIFRIVTADVDSDDIHNHLVEVFDELGYDRTDDAPFLTGLTVWMYPFHQQAAIIDFERPLHREVCRALCRRGATVELWSCDLDAQLDEPEVHVHRHDFGKNRIVEHDVSAHARETLNNWLNMGVTPRDETAGKLLEDVIADYSEFFDASRKGECRTLRFIPRFSPRVLNLINAIRAGGELSWVEIGGQQAVSVEEEDGRQISVLDEVERSQLEEWLARREL